MAGRPRGHSRDGPGDDDHHYGGADDDDGDDEGDLKAIQGMTQVRPQQ